MSIIDILREIVFDTDPDIAPHKPLPAPNSAQSYLASGSRMEDRGEMSGEKIFLGR